MNEYNCPECNHPLSRAVPTGGSLALSEGQFEAIKAGDWYCDAGCKGTRGKSGLRYYWESELK